MTVEHLSPPRRYPHSDPGNVIAFAMACSRRKPNGAHLARLVTIGTRIGRGPEMSLLFALDFQERAANPFQKLPSKARRWV